MTDTNVATRARAVVVRRDTATAEAAVTTAEAAVAAADDPRAENSEHLHARLRRLLAGATSVRGAKAALTKLPRLLEGFDHDATVRFHTLQLLERSGSTEDLTSRWRDLLSERRADVAIVRIYARKLVKNGDKDEAQSLIFEHFPPSKTSERQNLSRAELLDDIKAFPQADDLFRELIDDSKGTDARIAFAKRLRKRGLLRDAVEVISPIAERLSPGSKAAQLAQELLDDYDFFSRLGSSAEMAGQDIKIVAMRQSILYFRNARSNLPKISGTPSVAMVTGNLGAGGAERQLSRLAGLMQANIGSPDAIASRVDVVVKQFALPDGAPSPQLAFFLPELIAANVRVHQLNEVTPVAAANQGFVDANLLRLLDQLPPQVHYGVTRFLPWLRENPVDVVSLWQDGTCLFAALAALMAQVPVIQLVFRGLPPNIRRERFRPEYEVLYRALAEVPGVHFVSNSCAAAHQYADWLGLPEDRFEILYNGVPDVLIHGAEEDVTKWTEFDLATANATETIGGVFRAEPDKRPLVWINLADRYLKLRPKARFVHVGGGRLMQETQALARHFGIADRILFVGHSSNVGYWFDKMNVKVMLSRFEGLPNVLIEAQVLGVPVVSTPAGGAEECFVHGVSGHLLACAEHPDLDDACAATARYADLHIAGSSALKEGQTRARTLFSVATAQRAFGRMCLAGNATVPSQEDGSVARERLMVAA